jgi:hypothetical protein
MKIEKGKKYRCLRWNGEMFTKGKIYESIENGKLVDNDCNISYICMFEVSRFELVEEPTTEELLKRIEALENRVMIKTESDHREKSLKAIDECILAANKASTSAKFKAIADHANAINDIIKNAP